MSCTGGMEGDKTRSPPSACRDLRTHEISESNKAVQRLLSWPKEGMVSGWRQVAGGGGLILKDEEAITRHRKGRNYSRVRKADPWSNSC